MKRFILGALAALGGIGLYKLRKDGIRFPVLKIKGNVDSVNYEAGTFRLRSALNHNIIMDMTVSQATKFMWLKPLDGADNIARFADLTDGEKLSVAFSKHKESGRFVAERVIIENA